MLSSGAAEIPDALQPGNIVLVEGVAFCVSGRNGDITPGGSEGVYFRDTRLISRWSLLVDEQPLEALAVHSEEPFSAVFVTRCRPRHGRSESTLMVTRAREVGRGMQETIMIQNFSDEPAGLLVSLRVDADLADIFEVKSGRVTQAANLVAEAAHDGLTIKSDAHHRRRGVRVSAAGAVAHQGELSFEIAIPARGMWQVSVTVRGLVNGQEIAPDADDPPDAAAQDARRYSSWEKSRPRVLTSHPSLAQVLRTSTKDLGSLRIFDPEHPERPPSIAAGAPWFMSVFGRDSIITSWMALPLDQSIALGTLMRLADLQGTRVDSLSEEEPGKVMHELRHNVDSNQPSAHGTAYYGSVDVTPLFVMLLGELRRWGIHADWLELLLPHADHALQWIREFGDQDGDGFVEYCRKTDKGLVNQGWKDSFDAINFMDGTLAKPPIALAEVQAYVYAAYLVRAGFAEGAGDTGTAEYYRALAYRLKKAFNDAFWLPEKGWYAVGLDCNKKPIDALTSNIGHCLLTGIADPDKAACVVGHLMGEDMFTGWGIRTLGASMGAYNPMSYHNGSVWPHDNALIATGMMRYGYVKQSRRLAMRLLEATNNFGGRLPELFCGFSRSEFASPVPYPTACSPQAWASATPIQLLRVLLQFEPSAPSGRLAVGRALPGALGNVRIEGLSLFGSRICLRATKDAVEVEGLPPNVELLRGDHSPPNNAPD